MSVERGSERAEYFFEEGCFISEWSNGPHDEALSVARARVRPGETTRWHALKETTERYVIVSGRGYVELGDGTATEVTSGDVVIIPADTAQRITACSEADLVFLALCTPRFRPANYRDLEDPENG